LLQIILNRNIPDKRLPIWTLPSTVKYKLEESVTSFGMQKKFSLREQKS